MTVSRDIYKKRDNSVPGIGKTKGYRYAQVKKSRGKRFSLIRDLKEALPWCADCGGRFPAHVLDFDHAHGEKDFQISGQIGQYTSNARFLAEVAKCDVVCSNCHRERTYRRRWAAKDVA